MNPSVWQYSVGFQYQVRQNSTVEASYVGSRSYNLNMSAPTTSSPAAWRSARQCNYLEGGNAAFCNAAGAEPVPGHRGVQRHRRLHRHHHQPRAHDDAVSAVHQASRPAPGLTQLGRNDSTISYDSLQINYNLRMRSGLSLLGNYTFSKQVEEWGFLDRYTNLHQNGLYFLDRPHVIKLTAI